MPSFLFDLSSTKKTTQDADTSSPGIHNYACSFMADLLLVEEFNDAVHEGDGERMLTIWKVLLLNFRATRHTNYAAESVRLIAEALALLTERDAHRLKWCRFINTKGKPGKNISCDLGMELCIQAALGYCWRKCCFINYYPHWNGPLNTE